MNLLGSDATTADYERWGYPTWFHYVTGVLELSAAGLLLFSKTRRHGAGLGGIVMAAAAITLIVNGEFAHSLAPISVLLLASIVFWSLRSRAGDAPPRQKSALERLFE